MAVNGRPSAISADALWGPVFNEAGDKVLVGTLNDGQYTRQVLSLAELQGSRKAA